MLYGSISRSRLNWCSIFFQFSLFHNSIAIDGGGRSFSICWAIREGSEQRCGEGEGNGMDRGRVESWGLKGRVWRRTMSSSARTRDWFSLLNTSDSFCFLLIFTYYFPVMALLLSSFFSSFRLPFLSIPCPYHQTFSARRHPSARSPIFSGTHCNLQPPFDNAILICMSQFAYSWIAEETYK